MPRGCLGFLSRFLPSPPEDSPPSQRQSGLPSPRVMVSTKFVSRSEGDFFRVLREAVGDGGHVLAQVALNRVLFFPGNRGTAGRAAWQNKAARRSIDFLVCDPQTLRPLVAIELDDASHNAPARVRRDDEVETLLAAAGLPFVRFRARRTYHTQSVADAVRPHLAVADGNADTR